MIFTKNLLLLPANFLVAYIKYIRHIDFTIIIVERNFASTFNIV